MPMQPDSHGHDSSRVPPDCPNPVAPRCVHKNRANLFERAGFIACTPEILSSDLHLRALFDKWMRIFEETIVNGVETPSTKRRPNRLRAKAERPVFLERCKGTTAGELVSIGFDPLSGTLYIAYTVQSGLAKAPYMFRNLIREAVEKQMIVIE